MEFPLWCRVILDIYDAESLHKWEGVSGWKINDPLKMSIPRLKWTRSPNISEKKYKKITHLLGSSSSSLMESYWVRRWGYVRRSWIRRSWLQRWHWFDVRRWRAIGAKVIFSSACSQVFLSPGLLSAERVKLTACLFTPILIILVILIFSKWSK